MQANAAYLQQARTSYILFLHSLRVTQFMFLNSLVIVKTLHYILSISGILSKTKPFKWLVHHNDVLDHHNSDFSSSRISSKIVFRLIQRNLGHCSEINVRRMMMLMWPTLEHKDDLKPAGFARRCTSIIEPKSQLKILIVC